MKATKLNSIVLIVFLVWSNLLFGEDSQLEKEEINSDDVELFITQLKVLMSENDNYLFDLHLQSMIDVIAGKNNLTTSDVLFIQEIAPDFFGTGSVGDPSVFESYLARKRPLVISWTSPTDGEMSFGRLKLPVDYDPDKTYPLYIELHGLWNVADNPIDFMTYSFRNSPSSSSAFEDGFTFSPWGRGNMWYEGISEIDIWEGIDVLENVVKVDQNRKYLTGHSMGGYGAWNIGAKSTEVWAGLGIYAGALWYGTKDMLSDEMINSLSSMPVYFVCGTSDGLYNINYSAYNSLMDAGNFDVSFAAFPGGHDYLSVNVENMYNWLRLYSREGYDVGVKRKENASMNPIQFSPSCIQSESTIQLQLEKPGHVTLKIYDSLGKQVAKVLDQDISSGQSTFLFNREKEGLSSGLYFYLFDFEGKISKGKIAVQ